LDDGVNVRDALPGELPAIGDLRVVAYESGGFLSDDSHYTETLRGLGADGLGQVLAAEEDGVILGTVMLQLWPHAGHVARGPDDAEIRALAVAPVARGRGVGRALLRAATERAAGLGVRNLVLCTQPDMLTAQHLYLAEGFQRIPDRDWCPVPGFLLLAYVRPLPRP
jgi:ribosomal protein S18 acetylase RimI-like enzyme